MTEPLTPDRRKDSITRKDVDSFKLEGIKAVLDLEYQALSDIADPVKHQEYLDLNARIKQLREELEIHHQLPEQSLRDLSRDIDKFIPPKHK